jgi:protein TonB
MRSYFGQISAWIDANKDYPTEVKKKRQQGTVVVRFTIGRDGQLLASTIKQSSGHVLLDRAALETLARAAPFPPIPEFVGRETSEHRRADRLRADHRLATTTARRQP